MYLQFLSLQLQRSLRLNCLNSLLSNPPFLLVLFLQLDSLLVMTPQGQLHKMVQLKLKLSKYNWLFCQCQGRSVLSPAASIIHFQWCHFNYQMPLFRQCTALDCTALDCTALQKKIYLRNLYELCLFIFLLCACLVTFKSLL